MAGVKGEFVSETKIHAKFSPSSAKRLLSCPGSIRLSESAPPPQESKFALEGTKGHECHEFLLKNQHRPIWASKKAADMFPHQMVVHAEFSVNEIMRRVPPGAEVLAETKCDLSFIHKDFYGTADAVIIEDFGTLTVADYKYGAGIAVEADSPQLIAYALSQAHKYDYSFEKVTTLIIQPRAFHRDGPIRTHDFSMKQMKTWKETFSRAIENALRPNAEIIPADPKDKDNYCRFCPASSICPALSKIALRDAGIEFDDLTGKALVPEMPAIPSNRLINGARLGETLRSLDKIDVWAKEVRKLAFNMLEAGRKIPGWKLVERRGTRHWVDAEKAGARASAGIGAEAFTKPELKSPAQIEALGPEGKKFAKKYSTQVSSGFTMVPDHDSRIPTNTAQKSFEDLTRKGQG